MDEDSSFPAQEEVVFLILHEIIDQMFDDGDDTKKKIKEEAYDSAEEVGDFPLDGAVAAIPPPAAMEPVPAVPPATALAPKRRRLGVNAGAHEQILRLRDALAYVTDERDMWKKRCREMEMRLSSRDLLAWEMEAELTGLRRLVERFRRGRERRRWGKREEEGTKIEAGEDRET